MTETRARMRVWINGIRAEIGAEWVTGGEAGDVYRRLLERVDGRPPVLADGDWWLAVTEKADGSHWFCGGDPFGALFGDRAVALARRVAAEEWGERLPEGEIGEQLRQGPRVPPEYRLPGPE